MQGQGRVWAPKAPCILQEACAEHGLPSQNLRGSVWSSTQSPASSRGTHCSLVAVTGTAGPPRTGSPRLHSPPVLWRRPAQVKGVVEGGLPPCILHIGAEGSSSFLLIHLDRRSTTPRKPTRRRLSPRSPSPWLEGHPRVSGLPRDMAEANRGAGPAAPSPRWVRRRHGRRGGHGHHCPEEATRLSEGQATVWGHGNDPALQQAPGPSLPVPEPEKNPLPESPTRIWAEDLGKAVQQSIAHRPSGTLFLNPSRPKLRHWVDTETPRATWPSSSVKKSQFP